MVRGVQKNYVFLITATAFKINKINIKKLANNIETYTPRRGYK